MQSLKPSPTFSMERSQIHRVSVADQVASILRQRILNGELRPGTPLQEVPLAESLGVSRNTMREATRTRIELNESKTTYEEILKDFFARVLERPSDEALIMLWTLAFEMCFFTIEQHAAERLQSLFGDLADGA